MRDMFMYLIMGLSIGCTITTAIFELGDLYKSKPKFEESKLSRRARRRLKRIKEDQMIVDEIVKSISKRY